MNFKTILNEVYGVIFSENDNKKREEYIQQLEEQISSDPLLTYQFNMLQLLKKAKSKLKTQKAVNRFIENVNQKHLNFIQENGVSTLDFWKSNQFLVEYYNINPNTLSVSLIDKALSINNNTKLNEIVIKKYLGEKKNVNKILEKKSLIKESFINIMQRNDEKSLQKNIKIIRFLGECVNREDKFFILKSLKKIKSMITSNNVTHNGNALKEATKKAYKLRLITEGKVEDGIEDEELGNKYSSTLDQQLSREEERNYRSHQTSPGRSIKLSNLEYIKKIEITAPRNYKNPEKIIISFLVPFYTKSPYHSEITQELKYIKKRFDQLERIFINREIYEKHLTDIFDPRGTIWESSLSVNGTLTSGTVRDYKLDIYLHTNPNSQQTWKTYYQTAYEMLTDFDKYLKQVFPTEMEPPEKYEKKKGNRIENNKIRNNPKDKQRTLQDYSFEDNFGGMF